MKDFIERLSPTIQNEYELAKLLKEFRSLCDKARDDKSIERRVRTLYRKSTNKQVTTKNIFQQYCGYSAKVEDLDLLYSWVKAFLNKQETRKQISSVIKRQLESEQDSKCAICKNPLDSNDAKNHVDHIIPFKYVGDELDNNYQVLCEYCNKHKSSKTDYVFLHLLGLT